LLRIKKMTIQTDSFLFNYFKDTDYDEILSKTKDINPVWSNLLSNIQSMGVAGLVSRQSDIDWYIAENGVTYNVYNDPQGMNRPWELNVMPSLIHEDEWDIIEKGIQQRAELLNLILKDIYGKRDLIKKGIIPQEVVFSHRGFLRACEGIQYVTDKNLLIYSAELARGPNGQMWVVNDRTQAPSGMGYALENRQTMARVLPDLFENMQVKRLSKFFQQFNELLISSSPHKNDNPTIVVLTPGPHNETYFEHAYLASFFGYPLVQGNDLTIRNGYLCMKSLKGLKQIDVVLCRVDDAYVDPLELKEDSHLGVAGLLDVIRRKNVSIVNSIGSRVLENSGLIPFLPAAAKYFFNEDLILPQIATWWCGQEKERNYVFDNLSSLIIKKIDRTSSSNIYFGDKMSESELNKLKAEITERPYRFVAQEKINFSTTPTLNTGVFEPRTSLWRTFAISYNNKYSVMPGGLMRVAGEKGNINVSNQKGGTSKDLWIIESNKREKKDTFFNSRKSFVSVSGMDDLPSLTAENLFWAGRYVGRALLTARFLRTVLKQMSFVKYDEQNSKTNSLQDLLQALTHLTQTYPGFVGEGGEQKLLNPQEEVFSVILDINRAGSLSQTMSLFSSSYYSIRNLWSSDMWRVFERIDTIWKELLVEENINEKKIILVLDSLITRLIAFMGLIEESILIDQGLLLYFVGLQLEQSVLTISKCRSLLVSSHSDQLEYETLESLLNSHESLNIYRYTYRSYITAENVIELILLDQKYPRSLAFQLNRLNKDLSELPHSKAAHELTDYQKVIFKAYSMLKLSNSVDLSVKNAHDIRADLDEMLSDIYDLLLQSSNFLNNTYFRHSQKQNQLVKLNMNL